MPPEESLKTADLIRELRQQLGLSQEKLAARLGVSYLTVHRWENSQTKPSPMAIKLIEAELKLMGAIADKPSSNATAQPNPAQSRCRGVAFGNRF